MTLVVQNLDSAARRISLAPEGAEVKPADDDKAWKQHSRVGGAVAGGGMTLMAQALQKAMQNK
ncbi:MAG: hypothetical protein J5960_02710 [Desulfovibrio sp.]|nr:hypothetical protein [Desulfovibrio sp.]